TVYVFDVDHGGSALPADTGPPVGLARRHSRQERIDLSGGDALDSPRCRRRRVRKFDHAERMTLLKTAKYSTKEIADFCFEAIDIRKSRLATLEEFEAKRQARRRKLLLATRQQQKQQRRQNDLPPPMPPVQPVDA
ncbi:hypothetical protein As57867_019157, partial [Aphanomyces stellatus]